MDPPGFPLISKFLRDFHGVPEMLNDFLCLLMFSYKFPTVFAFFRSFTLAAGGGRYRYHLGGGGGGAGNGRYRATLKVNLYTKN